jgi:hypothetical protein
MITRKSITGKNCGINIWTAAAVALAVLSAGTVGYAQSAADIARQNMEEVVRLTQAKMTDEVLVTYIKTSGKTYSLSSDDLLYLNSRGVSQAVLDAMLVASGGVAPAPAPPPAAVITAPPETPTIDYFRAHLTPYGQWIDVPDVGAAWVPAEANTPGWRPYMNAGHWQFSDAGWFWQSDYPWGDMGFHYGRWINNEFTGGRWGWAPGYNWAPSWVSWREGTGGMGWAPLPWGVEFRVGSGLYWHGALAVGGIDFGLGFGAFCFVGADHFWGGNYNTYVFNESQSRVFFESSTFNVGYNVVGGRVVFNGLGQEHMAQITHHPVVAQKATELRRTEETHNFAKRVAEHKDLARVAAHAQPGRPGERATGTAAERARTTGTAAERARTTGTAAEREKTTGTAAERERTTGTAAAREKTTGTAAEREKTAGTAAEREKTAGTAAEHEKTTGTAAEREKTTGTAAERTTHPPEAHSTTPGNTHPTTPGGTHPTTPAPAAKPLAPKPKPPTSGSSTNKPPTAPH